MDPTGSYVHHLDSSKMVPKGAKLPDESWLETSRIRQDPKRTIKGAVC